MLLWLTDRRRFEWTRIRTTLNRDALVAEMKRDLAEAVHTEMEVTVGKVVNKPCSCLADNFLRRQACTSQNTQQLNETRTEVFLQSNEVAVHT